MGMGGTLARYAAEGARTYLLCATRGERGWFDSEGPDPGLEGVARIREAELRCAADRNFVDADVRPPHRVLKFYCMVDSQDIVSAANEAFGGISMEVDGVTRRHVAWDDWQITTWLDNSRYMDRVQKAIRCHKSQLPGYGPMAEWSLVELEKVFGTGHFYRAFSLVNGGRNVETDLFEGLR